MMLVATCIHVLGYKYGDDFMFFFAHVLLTWAFINAKMER